MKKIVRKVGAKKEVAVTKKKAALTKPKEKDKANKLSIVPVTNTPASQKAESEDLGLREIKELIELIAEKEFTDFELERGAFRLRLSRGSAQAATETFALTSAPVQIAPPTVVQLPTPAAAVQVESPAPTVTTPITPTAPAEESLHVVTSPIVGTFYRASSPTSAAFANIGDTVTEGKTLCIVEAMKLMNEIQSDVSGTVAKIFVENGQPVEYGQPLFGIKL